MVHVCVDFVSPQPGVRELFYDLVSTQVSIDSRVPPSFAQLMPHSVVRSVLRHIPALPVCAAAGCGLASTCLPGIPGECTEAHYRPLFDKLQQQPCHTSCCIHARCS